jgi:hypothetical protein
MYQKDYILRMLEMLSDLIALILGLIKKGDITQASERIERVYYDLLKQDSAFFRNIPEDKLTQTLLEKHNYTNGHLEVLAELFNAEAELRMAQGDSQGCAEYSKKSLLLFEFIDKEYKTFSFERDQKINDIKDRIERLKIRN